MSGAEIWRCTSSSSRHGNMPPTIAWIIEIALWHVRCHSTSFSQFLDYQIMIINTRPILLSGAILHPFRLLRLHKNQSNKDEINWWDLTLVLLCSKHYSFWTDGPLERNDKCMITKIKSQYSLFPSPHNRTHTQTFQDLKNNNTTSIITSSGKKKGRMVVNKFHLLYCEAPKQPRRVQFSPHLCFWLHLYSCSYLLAFASCISLREKVNLHFGKSLKSSFHSW